MKVRGGRCLLNRAGSETTAAIVAEVEDTRGWKEGHFRKGEALSWDDETKWNLSPYVALQLSDCNRAVAFTIRWEEPDERRAALEKVDRMIRTLTTFRDALEDEQKRYVVRMAAAKKAGPPPKKPDA